MAEVVKMPKMSDTMTEGVLAKWHKKVGDKIKSGDVLAEIETDKATMDFESYQDGTLLYIGVEEGKAVPVDAVIGVIGKEGEDYKAALSADSAAAPAAEEKKEEAWFSYRFGTNGTHAHRRSKERRSIRSSVSPGSASHDSECAAHLG
ncbi:MAG: biotin/lipoyl-containing protein, partial [Mucilaginibacter sp.]